MLQFNKILICEMFQDVSSWSRMDFLCSLIQRCNPFELRFIGSLIEDLAQIDYNTLRDQDMKANSSENLSQYMEKSMPPNELRSHLTMCLALLHSSNYRVAEKLAEILDNYLKEVDVDLSSGRSNVAEECMLMLTLAAFHPAFSFEKKLLFMNKREEYERVMFHRKNARCGRYCRTSNQFPPSRYNNTVNQDFRTESMPFGHHHATMNYMYPHEDYFVTLNGDQYPNLPPMGHMGVRPPIYADGSNSYRARHLSGGPRSRGGNPQRSYRRADRTHSHEPHTQHREDKEAGILSDGDKSSSLPTVVASTSELLRPPPAVVTTKLSENESPDQDIDMEEVTSSPNSEYSSSSHCLRSSLSCVQTTSVTGTNKLTSVHVPIMSTSSHTISGISSSTNCKHKPTLSLEGGDVCPRGTPERDLKPDSPIQPLTNFKQGDNSNSALLPPSPEKTTNNVKNSTSVKQVAPLRVSDIHFHYDNASSSTKKKISKCTMKVEWKDGKTSTCEKSIDDVINFYQQICRKIEKSNSNLNFLTRQQNQINEKTKKLEELLNDLLSSPDTDAQDLIVSFFSPTTNNQLPSTSSTSLSLPFKKRKLKTESRSRSRMDHDSSSSSSPPLPSNRGLLSPASYPASSLSPQSVGNSISGSSALSSPSPSASYLTSNSLMDDEDNQTDPYLKVRDDSLYYWLKQRNLHHVYSRLTKFTFDQFFNLENSEVDSISGISVEDKTTLKKEMLEIKTNEPEKTSSLEIDMGKLALEKNGKDIKTIISASEDEKSNSSRAAVAFETSDEAVNNSLHTEMKFNFEFDSSSATSDIAQETSVKNSLSDPNPPGRRRFSADAHNQSWCRRNTASPSEYSQSKVPVQSLYMTSTSAPPMSQMSYYIKHPRSHSTEQYVMGQPMHRQSPPYTPSYPIHPNPVPMFPPRTQNVAPSSNHAPIFPMNTPSTLPSPLLQGPNSKQVFLTYTPTSTPCTLMGEVPIKMDNENITHTTGYYQVNSEIPPMHSGMLPQGTSMPPAYSTELPPMPQSHHMYPAPATVTESAPGQSENDMEDTQSVTSDTDPNTRPTDQLGVPVHAPPYLVPRSNFSSNSYIPNCFYTLAPNPHNMYNRVPPQDVQWAPMQPHQPLGPSYSDPNIYSQSKTDYPTGVPMPPFYFMPNGYPDHRPPFPMSADQVRGAPTTQPMSGPLNMSKEPFGVKQPAPPSCFNCGTAGHLASDCSDQHPAEVLGSGYKLQLSQPTNNKGGNG